MMEWRNRFYNFPSPRPSKRQWRAKLNHFRRLRRWFAFLLSHHSTLRNRFNQFSLHTSLVRESFVYIWFFLFVFSLYFNSIPKLGDLLPPMMESVYNLYRRSASAGLITKTSTSHNINTRREERREEKNVFLRCAGGPDRIFPREYLFFFLRLFFSFSSTRQPHSFWMVFTVFTLFQSRLFFICARLLSLNVGWFLFAFMMMMMMTRGSHSLFTIMLMS